ncbi:MAG: hypothetical protein KDC24_02255, partial [Saprospiraceae bacterium]|nr:hypothetical protein [Saprospiraceae bacterium]
MKSFITLLALFGLLNNSFSQTMCGMPEDEPPGCTICSPVIIFSTAYYSPGTPGPTFPCGTIENNSWMNFIAGSSNISATIFASNCNNGQGVQLLIYDQHLNPVSTCFSSNGNNVPGNVTAQGLIPGEVYWIMVDGYAGDICDVNLTITGGMNIVSPDPPGPIMSASNTNYYCPGDIDTFYIDPVNNATFYDWTIPPNSQILGLTNTSIILQFTNAGAGLVCVEPGNGCFPGVPVCLPVVARPLFPVVLPLEQKCASEFPFYIDSTLINGTGAYTITYITATGCDSVVTYVFEEIPNGILNIDTSICIGESIPFNGQTISQSGTYHEIIPNASVNGCDSLLELNLNVIGGPLNFQHVQIIDCIPGSILTLNTNNISLPPGATFYWETLNGGNIVSGANSLFPVVDAVGSYVLHITSNGLQTCIGADTLNVEVRTPPSRPVFDSIHTANCVLDTGFFSILPLNDADSVFWFFEDYDTLVTSFPHQLSFPWNGRGGLYNLTVQAKNGCGWSAPIDTTLTLLPIANPDMVRTLSPQFCKDLEMVYTWNIASFPADSMVWDLDGGQFTNGHNPPSTNSIHWDDPGTKYISVYLKDDGCTSLPFKDTLMVDDYLDPLILSCSSTNNSVTFSWLDVPGASGYDVNVLTGQSGTQGANTFELTGLSPNEVVSVRVQAFGNTSCGASSATLTCTAMDCPTLQVNVAPVPPICLDFSVMPIQLQYTVTGGSGNGNANWSGPGILQPGGIFQA